MNGKWRLLYDLREINEVMEDMGALQPGLPTPIMLPQSWTLIVIDLKDCLLPFLVAGRTAENTTDTSIVRSCSPFITRIA